MTDPWFNEVFEIARRFSIKRKAAESSRDIRRFRTLTRDSRKVYHLLPVLMDWERYPMEIWQAAERAVVMHKEQKGVVDFYTRALLADSTATRRRAARVLAQLTPVKATQTVLDQAKRSTDYVVRCHALHTALVLAMKNRRLRPEVMRLAKLAVRRRTLRERLAGYNCFEIFGDHTAGEYFRRAMDDRDPVIRANAKSWYDEWASRQKDNLKRKQR